MNLWIANFFCMRRSRRGVRSLKTAIPEFPGGGVPTVSGIRKSWARIQRRRGIEGWRLETVFLASLSRQTPIAKSREAHLAQKRSLDGVFEAGVAIVDGRCGFLKDASQMRVGDAYWAEILLSAMCPAGVRGISLVPRITATNRRGLHADSDQNSSMPPPTGRRRPTTPR